MACYLNVTCALLSSLMCSQRAMAFFFFFLSRFSNSFGFSPLSPHPTAAVCTCGQSCSVLDVISQSRNQGSALSHSHVGHSVHPEQVPYAACPPGSRPMPDAYKQRWLLLLFLVGNPWTTTRLLIVFLSPRDTQWCQGFGEAGQCWSSARTKEKWPHLTIHTVSKHLLAIIVSSFSHSSLPVMLSNNSPLGSGTSHLSKTEMYTAANVNPAKTAGEGWGREDWNDNLLTHDTT